MKEYIVKYARVEQQLYTFFVDANSEDEAKNKIELIMQSDDFDWDDYEVIHAEEFIVDTTELKK